MAKKKVDPQTESNSHKSQDTANDDQIVEETPAQKIVKLKSLNALLLKETVERRHQVDSLAKSNGHLESELSRSVMDNGLLKSEMNGLTEKAVMLEIEKGLVSVVVVTQVNQLAEEKIESFKEMIGSLEGDLKRVLEEKSEIEKSKSDYESEIIALNSRLDELMAEIDEERGVSSRVCDERDELMAHLGDRIQEVGELKLKVAEAEKTEARISEELMELKAKHDVLLQQNSLNSQLIDSITSEKDLIQAKLVESNGQIDDLKRNIDDLLEQKKATENQKSSHERNNEELQTMVSELKDLIENMKNDELELLEKLTDLEKKYASSSENEVVLKNEINGFVEEKKETNERIKSLENEKSSVLKDFEDAMKELHHQKLTIEQIVQEKNELQDAKVQGETEIVKMKEQLFTFQDTISSLQNSSLDETQKLKQLESEVSHYKDSLNQATIERDEALKNLEQQEAIKTEFHHKITQMENQIKELHEDLTNKTTENSKNLQEKNELENHCAELAKNISVLETKLAETREEFDETKNRFELAKDKSNRVLITLKRTLSGHDEKLDLDKDHVTEVEEIKRVFKEKDIKVEEMKRQLELITNTAEEVRKEKSFWALVSSATTLLAAAVSVAYVARAN
ncbi:hypothetical protein L1887_35543 [Cichorium endivia]|nr:hypothetical protein L1887_35543 [Cichorium endivia]